MEIILERNDGEVPASSPGRGKSYRAAQKERRKAGEAYRQERMARKEKRTISLGGGEIPITLSLRSS